MFEKRINYAKRDSDYRRHHARFARHVNAMKLTCQECGGAGGEKEVILDDGTGPWFECGWCEGTGLTTKHRRGLWLKIKRQERREQRQRQAAASV